jgi:hypothetical protein
MQDDGKPHRGPWRVMQVDSDFAGIFIALAFVVLGIVSMPILAPIILLGVLPMGIAVALLLRFTAKK